MPDHASNRKTEKEALKLLVEEEHGFYVPTREERKHLLKLLGVSQRFAQTFDAVRLHVKSIDKVKVAADFDLIETKTTKAFLPNLPKGFFFGMTENEEMLLKVLEDKYFLCFVSLHPDSRSHALVGWNELKKLTRNKRIQYQINLANE